MTDVPVKADAEKFAIPLVFFVSAEQNEIIEEALSKVTIQPGRTKTQQRASAITKIAEYFLAKLQ
jgi:hypothetical protein